MGDIQISIHALLAESDRERAPALSQSSAFLSTLSLRRATFKILVESQRHNDFYPRSPCGERRDVIAAMTEAQSISIHALLAESDTQSAPSVTPTADFYPRSPCGERPLPCNADCSYRNISIHALLAESDQPATSRNDKDDVISIHALLAESDGKSNKLAGRKLVFLSTLSLRRATEENPTQKREAKAFLSTLSLRRATRRPIFF